MNKTLTTLVAGAFLVATASPALAVEHGDTPAQLCVQDTDGLWFAFVAETADDWTWIGSRRFESLPNTAKGCESYGPQKQAPELPAPELPAPELPAPDPAPTCDVAPVPAPPEPQTVVQVVEVPVRVVEYVYVPTTDTEALDKLQRKIDRQVARIASLKGRR